MRKAWLVSVVGALMILGCRRTDWREVTLPLSQPMSRQQLQYQLATLDQETPPEVVVLTATHVTLRYNSMNVAKRNLEVALAPR